jgi:hypothetical protein
MRVSDLGWREQHKTDHDPTGRIPLERHLFLDGKGRSHLLFWIEFPDGVMGARVFRWEK